MDCADEAPLFLARAGGYAVEVRSALPDVKENALRWINELKSQTADTRMERGKESTG